MTFLLESEQRNNFTRLYRFYREDGEKKIETIDTFRPYFYLPQDEIVPDNNRITEVESGHISILGEPLKKLYVQKSGDVKDLREQFEKHYEADILFTRRYIIDKIGPIEPYPLRTLYLDIETNTDEEMPDVDNPNQEVTCISLLDSFTNKIVTIMLEPPNSLLVGIGNIRTFKTEEELLGAFLNYIKELDPDILTNWFIERFDLVYLIRRMEKLGIDYKQMSPLGVVKIDDKRGESSLKIIIKGRIVIDMLKLYTHFRGVSNQGRAEEYSLDFTAKEVLGEGKIEHSESFRDLWFNNPAKLIKYNQQDVMLVKKIDEKLNLINFFNRLRCKTCSLLTDIFTESKLIDGLLLRKEHNKRILPSSPKDPKDEPYKGAYIIVPTPGVYENIFGFDVRGMYPNIIKSFNTSFETFDPSGDIKIEEGIAFNKFLGLIPEVVKDLDAEREMYISLMKEAKKPEERELHYHNQYIVKVLQSAFYGYCGYPKARLYKREVANAITTIGRRLIKWAKIVLENKGLEVLYGHTDSLFVKAKTKGLFNLLKEGKEIQKIINDSFTQFTDSYGISESSLEIELEKILESIIFVAKKDEGQGAKNKYAYMPIWLSKDPGPYSIDFTGFSSVRSDTSRISKKVEREVIKMLLNKVPKDEVDNLIIYNSKKVRNRELPDEEVTFPKGISLDLDSYGKIRVKNGRSYKTGTPPVVQGCRYSNKYLGTRFGKGSKPKWAYIKSVPPGYPYTRVLSFTKKLPDGFIMDYDIMIEKMFKDKLVEIYKAANLGEFPNLVNYSKLDKWGF